jgi:oxygen-independent coproporphyrinogen-3 oxidase
VETVFVGGGTPTVLPAEALEAILGAAKKGAGSVSEFTVEANPSSCDELKLDLLRRFEVNRISFGAQSFHRDDLAVLERIHDPRHVTESVRAARRAGFENINLDFIYGVPGQTLQRWRETLRRAIDLDTEHLSCYALMYEPGTSLTRLRSDGRIIACDEDLEAEMFELTRDELTASGFEHYEISNFAKPGRRCRANMIYWENREYLGIGPSAVSYLNGERRKNVPDVRKYIEAMKNDPSRAVVERERLDGVGRACETAIQMLRLLAGIDEALFRRQTGFDACVLFDEPIARFTALGQMESAGGRIRMTRRGLLLANRVMEEFLLPARDGASGSSQPSAQPLCW